MASLGDRRSVAKRIEALEALLGVADLGPSAPAWEPYTDEEALEIVQTLAEIGQLEAVLVGEWCFSAEEAQEIAEQLLSGNRPDAAPRRSM
jgi:hypothetical protein